jgi:hypothetical protein
MQSLLLKTPMTATVDEQSARGLVSTGNVTQIETILFENFISQPFLYCNLYK